MVVKHSRIKSGISQTGGKFRLVNRLRELTPYHEFFLSIFTGAAHFELNKPRCRYECWNDGESEIINYLVQIQEHQKEFDEMKQGVFGLVSQEICNRIVNGKITPKNDLERAYFFYYLNKLTFGGSIWKVRKKPPYQGMTVNNLSENEIENIKKEFGGKGYIGLIDNQTMSREGFGRVDSKVVENAKQDFEFKTKGFIGMVPKNLTIKNVGETKAKFRGVVLPTVCKDKSVEDAKASYRGIVPKSGAKAQDYKGIQGIENYNYKTFEKVKKRFKDINAPYSGIMDGSSSGWTVNSQRAAEEAKRVFKEINAPYAGIHNTRALGASANKRDLDKTKEQFKSVAYKGTNPKTTRPFTNNDCGLLSPIDPKAIKRLRYVNLTAYDFRRVYKMFYEAFYVRKGLERECFIYSDSPYPGTEKYYGDLFPPELHQELIDIALATPFNFMLSIGGNCEAYLEQLSDWNIIPVKVKYSTSANHQHDSQEYIIMNYEIAGVAKMVMDSDQKLIEKYF